MTCAAWFNLDGVLTDHDLDFAAIYKDAVDTAGLDALADGYEQYTDRFFDYFQNGFAYPRRQAIQDLLQQEGITDQGVSDAFATAWEDAEASRVAIRPGAADALAAVAADHPVGIATNGTGRLQRKKLEDNDLMRHVDQVVISSEVGRTKPDPQFFALCTELVDADTHVMVSQDIRRDLVPARKQGFKTVLLAREEVDDQVRQAVDAVARSLDEVPDAVDQACSGD